MNTNNNNDESTICKKLDQAFGTQPVTWFDIEELFPECSIAEMETFIAGGNVLPVIQSTICEVLRWRPSLRYEFELPILDDEERISLSPLIARDESGVVQLIRCRSDQADDRHAVQFERLDESTFAIKIEGIKDNEDPGLIVGGQLLPVLPRKKLGEWARVETGDIPLLMEGRSTVAISIRPLFIEKELPVSPHKSINQRYHLKVAAAIFISIIAGSLIPSPFGLMSDTSPKEIDYADNPYQEAITDFAHVLGEATFSVNTVRNRQGINQIIMFGQRAGDDYNSLNFYTASNGNEHIDDSQYPLLIPPQVSRWYTVEPHPTTMSVEAFDVLPDTINLGDELILNRRHRMTGVAIIQICDLDRNVLREIWNRGYLYSIKPGPSPETLLIVGASNRLPQSVQSMQPWEDHLLNGQLRGIDPNFVAIVDTSDLADHSGIFPLGNTPGFVPTPIQLYLAQPPEHAREGLILLGASRSELDGAVARLRFTCFNDQLVEQDTTIYCDVSANGTVIGPWILENGNFFAEADQFTDMVMIDTQLHNTALMTLNQSTLPTPGSDAQAFESQGNLISRTANLRSRSPIWVADEAYYALSDSRVDPRVAQLYLQELNGLLSNTNSSWSNSTHRKIGIVRALAFHRLGFNQQALELLYSLPVAGNVNDPTHYEVMILRSLILKSLGEHIEFAKQILILKKLVSELPPRRKWLIECDLRTRRIYQEATSESL